MEEYQDLWQKNVTARTSDFIVDEDGKTIVEDNSIVTVGGMITAKKVKTTKTNQLMAFVNLEDMVGTVEALIFPKVYEKHKQHLVEDSKVFLRGRASIGADPVGKLVCEDVIPFSEIPSELWIQFQNQAHYHQVHDAVMAALRNSEGKDHVVLYLREEKAVKRLSANWAVDARGLLHADLCKILGDCNVKVVEKTIQKKNKTTW
ncbi:MAG: DNA polymerase III subunit alpha, partial [Lachnospiraceae bacterium]|nr:DNA polymerase III subunit alpha [Lachnospiraceae bacterium]